MLRFLILAICFYSSTYAQSSKTDQAKKLYETKKYSEAKTILKQVEEESKEYAAAQYYLGRIAFDEREYDDAQDFFEAAVDTNDKVADYHEWLGNTYGTIVGDANPIRQGILAPKMKSAWEKAIALDAKTVSARTSLIQYYIQAPSFMGGSMEKAKDVAQQIIKLNPSAGHRALGNIYLQEKNTAAAENEYLEMIKADPTPNHSAILGNFYLTQKQYEKAFALFEESVKKNANDMSAVYQIGKASALSGLKLERGEECLKKYLAYKPKENEPSHAGANMRLGQIYEKRGNKAEAKKHYEIALKADASLQEAKEGLARVSK